MKDGAGPAFRHFVILLALALCARGFAAEVDGPYVMRGTDGKLEAWAVEVTDQGARRRVTPLAPGAAITIPAVGAVPALTVKLRAVEPIAPDTVSARRGTPLFVVADTHGEYEILVQMLGAHHVIDRKLNWSFGRGQLLILGDVFDRGAHHTEILWLLYALEAQARKAGGAMQFVLGNHETMVMRGDLRYLNPKYPVSARILGFESYSGLFGPDSVLGQWLRSKPAVLRLNQYLCLHGGISPGLVDRRIALPDINATVRTLLAESVFDTDAERERAVFLLGEQGPLWYRGYFARDGAPAQATDEDVDRIREHFGVQTILVGHTSVPTITPLFDGKVIAVQVYPRRDEAGKIEFEALLIRDKAMLRALPDGRTESLMAR
jgi:hypothetical protein